MNLSDSAIPPELFSQSSSGEDSSDASEGPVTPETRAQDPSGLIDIPELPESDQIGIIRLQVRKSHSEPLVSSLLPGAVSA